MPWPSIPGIIASDVVTLLKQSWTTNTDGTRKTTGVVTTVPNVPCTVTPESLMRMGKQDGYDDDLHRFGGSARWRVTFQGDVRLSVGDTILWTDDGGTDHTMYVTMYYSLGNLSGAFMA